LAAVALLTLGGAASAQEPPVTSIPNVFGEYDDSSGVASQPNMFDGSTFYRTSCLTAGMASAAQKQAAIDLGSLNLQR
jgi:hypothetical protein